MIISDFIMVLSDFIKYLSVPLSLDDLNNAYNTKINFREYAKITSWIKSHLEWKDRPGYQVPRPIFFLNILLSLDLTKRGLKFVQNVTKQQ